MGLGQNVAGLLGQSGAARAGGLVAQGAVPGQTFGQALQIGGTILGAMGGFGGLGGSGAASGAAGAGSSAGTVVGNFGGGNVIRAPLMTF
jgi:hypothetical protein